MNKIDNRKHYFIVLDTETAGGFDNPLVYDVGFAVVDKHGNIYETHSYIIKETFFNDKIMSTAYYGEKIPQYAQDIVEGSRVVKTLSQIKIEFYKTIAKYRIKEVCCHYARFDYGALNNTYNKYHDNNFFTDNITMWDSWKMAKSLLQHRNSYVKFCEKYGFLTAHKKPQPQMKAEILYRFITGDIDFIESHTGLEDVMIETKIVNYCFRQHKPMVKKLFN